MNRLSSNVPIKDRIPYFVQCSRCRVMVEGYYINELKDRCSIGGWRYDYEEDKVYCPECAKKLERESNIDKGGVK